MLVVKEEVQIFGFLKLHAKCIEIHGINHSLDKRLQAHDPLWELNFKRHKCHKEKDADYYNKKVTTAAFAPWEQNEVRQKKKQPIEVNYFYIETEPFFVI